MRRFNQRQIWHLGLLYTVVLGVAIGMADFAVADDTELLKQEFLNAVAGMEKKIQNLKLHVETIERSHWVETGKPTKDTVVRHEMACRGAMRLIKRSASEGGTEEITAKNDKYYFVLRKEAQSVELVELVPINTHEANNHATEIFDAIGSLGYVCAGYYGGHPWWKYVKLPGFSITGIRPDERPGCYRVDYETPNAAMPAPVIKNHYSIFDSNRGWVSVETGYDSFYPKVSNGNDFKFHDRYRFVDDDFVTVSGVEVNLESTLTTDRSDDTFHDEVIVKSTILSEDPPEEIFFLSHYGLAEPSFERRRGIWYLVISVALATVTYWISRRRRNQRSN